MKKILLILVLIPILLSSCTARDALTEPFYAEEIYTYNGTAWNLVQAGGILLEADPLWTASPSFGITAGDIAGWVVGPATATDEAIARYNTGTGKLIQNSTVLVYDWGGIYAPGDIDTDSAVNAEDLNCTNDLDVGDNADVAGDLGVVGTSHFGSAISYSAIAADGTLTMVGDARVINALWIDAGGIKAPGAKPATAIAHGLLETPAWQFANQAVEGNQETVSFSMRIPERMDRSVEPTISIGWSSTTTAGNVKWQLEYLWTSPNESTAAAAQETLTVTNAVSGVAEGLVESVFTGIDVPSGTDVCIHCRITRLSADAADTVADIVELHGLYFSWTSNKLGS